MKIPDHAIEAAAKALHAPAQNFRVPWSDLDPDDRVAWLDHATAALTAALPEIEAALRKQIAADIRAEIADYGEPLPYRDGVYAGLTQAARIAEKGNQK